MINLMSNYHTPVLLNETIEGLNVQPGGIYVDVTYGGGGHAREILKRLDTGRVIGFDRDADALKNALKDDRITMVNHNFIYLKRHLRFLEALPVDGILADLGVSSYQFDQADKGFSYRFDAVLDMRMDKDIELTAAHVCNTYVQDELQRIFGIYGEIKNASQLSRKIVEFRKNQAITKIQDLVDIAVSCMHHADIQNKYLSKVFQALRIEVNDELNSLKTFLIQANEVLKINGRLAIITYHSLEDRIVKNFFKSGTFSGKIESDILYGHTKPPFKLVHKKPITPSDIEIGRNPRARSAKLRIAIKQGEK